MWSLAFPETLSFRSWSDEDLSVVYNTLSGDTHLVESPGLEILQLLTESPRSAESLASALSSLFQDQEPDRLVQYIGATLLRLKEVGLITDTSH